MLIYSKVNKKKLIYSYFNFKKLNKLRDDFSPEKEFLQASCSILKKNRIVMPHKHKKNVRKINLTQEAWLIFEGSIKAKFYDIDDSFLGELILKKGDCVILFNGGHEFKTLKENTILFEFKNGPYYGSSKDRVEIKN